MPRKTSSRLIRLIAMGLRAHFPLSPGKTRAGLGQSRCGREMQLEFHQLDRRGEHLRVQQGARQKRLLASLAMSGQQTPIVVVAVGPS
jgi:hypothetical protein